MAEEEKETQEEKPAEAHAEDKHDTDWKALARKWEQRAKENKDAADELAQLKDSEKTEIEKANERAAKLEAERNALMAEKNVAGWKKEVSEASGVPADVLRGTSMEEIEAHAETLKPYFEKEPAPVIGSDGRAPRKGAHMTTAEQFAAATDGML